MYFYIIIGYFITTYVGFSEQVVCEYGFVYNGEKCVGCGLVKKQHNLQKIVGGTEAVKNSWPSQVYIRQKVEGLIAFFGSDNKTIEAYRVDKIVKCGGTLINSQTVLTAAHCITDKYEINKDKIYDINFDTSLEKSFTVYLGMHNSGYLQMPTVFDMDPTVIKAKVAKIIKHKDYDVTGHVDNDIALLILSQPVPITDEIIPACLPEAVSTTYPTINSRLFITGWGARFEGGFSLFKLRNVDIDVLDTSKCKFDATSFDKQICAGDVSGAKDSCQGDSGGGLYKEETISLSKKNIVAGIVSYGYGCGRATYGSIYTRTSYYLDWIHENWKTPDYVQTTTKRTTTKQNKN